MAGLIILVQATEQLIDYIFKATAAGAYPDEASLVSFFAIFYTASNLLAFGLQAGLGPRALATIGLGGTLAILPAAVAFASAGAALFQRIWSVSLARAANAVFAVSFFKAGFELLWTPVPAETKRPAKVYVDVAAGGLGDLAGAGLVLLMVAWIADLPGTVLLGRARRDDAAHPGRPAPDRGPGRAAGTNPRAGRGGCGAHPGSGGRRWRAARGERGRGAGAARRPALGRCRPGAPGP
jgi:hypothetical protein